MCAAWCSWSRSSGAAFARLLVGAGETVVEVPANLTERERRHLRRAGKTDAGDALAIARVALREPGLGPVQLGSLIGCPHEMLEFHLWYLRDKGWIMRTDTGTLAITADGVDRSLQLHQADESRKLITEDC